jgi:two-component system chemotaxis response regulator CheY
MRNIWKKVIANLDGSEVVEAGDGLEGLEAFKNNQPFDMMLVDWNMPNMNGLEMIGKIREQDKATPIIMVTTEAEKPRIIEAIKAGVNDYVVKPFTPDALLDKINSTMAKVGASA